MNIFLWIVLGGIAGWIASIIAGTNRQMGIVANIAVGIIGSIIGGGVLQFLGGFGVTGFNFYSLLVAVLGSVILLTILRLLGGLRPSS